YLSTGRAYSGLEGFVMLFRAGVNVAVTDDGRLVLSGPGMDAPLTLAPEGDPGAGAFVTTTGEDRLQFTFAEGRATGFMSSANAAMFERAGLLKQPQLLALLTVLTVIAALATLGGILGRMRREQRESLTQGRASLIQNTQALLWLVAIVLLGIWAARAKDVAQVIYNWPGAMLIIASACALLAAVLTVVTVVLVPVVWQGGRRVDSWSSGRKFAFTVTTLIYLAFSVVLFTWGALTPWG
ncbi:MAG TPA: serine hydrolase, partial [Phenylobacterium sp.]